MPIYEYQCGVCEHKFERLVLGPHCSPTDRRCPECGGQSHLVPSAPQLRFYGPGWFKPNVNKRGEGIGTKRKEPDEVS